MLKKTITKFQKKLFPQLLLKNLLYSQETPVLESLLNKSCRSSGRHSEKVGLWTLIWDPVLSSCFFSFLLFKLKIVPVTVVRLKQFFVMDSCPSGFTVSLKFSFAGPTIEFCPRVPPMGPTSGFHLRVLNKELVN